MGATAQFFQLGPFFSSGLLVASPKVYHYIAGSSTDKDAYTTRSKSATVAQPLVGDANGVASAYFDGLYKLVVKDASDNTLFTWDNVDLTEDEHRLEGSTSWDPGSLADGAGETSTGITVTGAAFGDYVHVAAPYSLQGVLCCGYVSGSNTVQIRLQNETGGVVDLASGTWTVRVSKQ